MQEEIIIAGFGGQGVLSMGQILCYSGVMENKEVVWMPSYGPEMRGGTANCIAIISDARISSPINYKNSITVIALNQPSLDKFEQAVKPGGLLIYEASTILNHQREQILISSYEAANEATKLKNSKVMNMIVTWCILKEETNPKDG